MRERTFNRIHKYITQYFIIVVISLQYNYMYTKFILQKNWDVLKLKIK